MSKERTDAQIKMAMARVRRRRGPTADRCNTVHILCLLLCLDQKLVESLGSLWGRRRPFRHGAERCCCIEYRRKQSLKIQRFVSSDDDSTFDDAGDDMIDSQERLQDAIGNLFRIGGSYTKDEVDPSVAYSVPNLEDPSTWNSQTLQPGTAEWKGMLPEQQALPESYLNPTMETGIVPGDSMPVVSDGFQGDDGEGVFLDTEDYIHTRDWLNSDGSLSLPQNDDSSEKNNYRQVTESILSPSTSLPDSEGPGRTSNDYTLQDVLKQPRPDSSATSEELHQMVFEKEEGYLKQSDKFREALTNESAREEALAMRRGKEFRERQAREVAELEEQIEEFEKNLGNAVENRATCAKCGCVMSEEEIHHFQLLQGAPESKRLCQVCYADVLKATSRAETEGFQAPSPPQWERNGGMDQQRSFPGDRASAGRMRPPAVKRDLPSERKALPRPSTGPPSKGVPVKSRLREGKTIVRPSLDKRPHPLAKSRDETSQIQSLQEQVRELTRLVQSYKSKAELAEQEIFRLRNTIAEMDEDLRTALSRGSSTDDAGGTTLSPWQEVEDPDTGEIFYWNEETEEMQWEL